MDKLRQQQALWKEQKDVTNKIGVFSGKHFWIKQDEISCCYDHI